MLDTVSRSDNRLSATELVTRHELRERRAKLHSLQHLKPSSLRHDERMSREPDRMTSSRESPIIDSIEW